MNNIKDATLSVAEGISVRLGERAILLEWKSECQIMGIVCQRHICEGIDFQSLPAWLTVLERGGEAETENGGLRIERRGDNVILTFARTIANPNSIMLSTVGQAALHQAFTTPQLQAQPLGKCRGPCC